MPRRDDSTTDPQLNLAPIMNMVVILVPLLLLSVVFLSVGTINVSAPSLSPEVARGEETEDPRITVAVGRDGFTVSSREGEIATVAPEDAAQLRDAIDRTRAAHATADGEAAEQALDDLLAAYDWNGLYEAMVAVKKQHPSTGTVHMTADPDVPYAVLVASMDAVRYRLEADRYDSDGTFWSANSTASGSSAPVPLFADPILNVAR
jgi:biopolymer transport protein ExbD